MRILAIGNIFESKSFLVDDFCEKDSEVIANNVISRISGAAIVVSAIAAFLNLETFLYSKVNKEHCINDMLIKLTKVGVDTRLIDIHEKKANLLLTIYNADLERKCYSYTPNQVLAEDLLKMDFSEFDATFFCCIPFEQLAPVFKKNQSLRKTKSVILASGLTGAYFEKNKLKVKSDYIFMNRGELLKVFKKEWADNQRVTYECCDQIDIGNTILVVTMGKDGVLIKDHGEELTVPVDNVSNIVHPGGAGDAFSVGFMKGILCGKSYTKCCEEGHRCAKKMLSVRSTEELLEKMI